MNLVSFALKQNVLRKILIKGGVYIDEYFRIAEGFP